MSKRVDRLLTDQRQSFLYRLSYAQVREWLRREESHNRFNPNTVAQALADLKAAYPEGTFVVGEECGRIVYFDTGVLFMELLANEEKAIAMTALEWKVRDAADEVRYQMGELLETHILGKNALGRSKIRFGKSTVFVFWWD